MRIIKVLLIINTFIASFIFAQWKSLGGSEGDPVRINVLKSDINETVVEFNVEGYYQRVTNIDKNSYVVLLVPDASMYLERGYPELPRLHCSLVIPDEARMKAEVIEAKYDTLSRVVIVPSRGSLPRSIDPKTVPYTFSDFYRTDVFWPANTIELSKPFILRDIRGITVRFNIFRHNAVRGQLIVCNHLIVRIFADGIDSVNIRKSKTAHPGSDFNKLYKRIFINFRENNNKSLMKSTYNDIGEAGRMLIIAADDFYKTILLRDWRTRKGYQTVLVRCSDVGTSANDIQSYIQNMYDEAGSVAYVLLVGDGDNIPSKGVPYPGGIYEPQDPIYSLLAGNDNYPDAYISRISAQNIEQVENQIRRIIKYETDPPSGTWFQKACGIASHEGNPSDLTRCNWLREDLLEYGYITVDKLYDITSPIPISNSINSGRGLVNYIGHGEPTRWGFNHPYVWPLFSVTNVQNLSNFNRLPFIFSVACEVGSFSEIGTCFAEAWLRSGSVDNPTGAIGFYGSSIVQPWVEPYVAQAEAVDLLVVDDKVTIGGLCFNGSCKMIENYPSIGPNVFKHWIIFGDAATQLWTKVPQTFANVSITDNTSSITVNTGVSDATICVSSGNNGTSYWKRVDNVSITHLIHP